MKEIKLTRGYVAIVDDDDFEYLNQWKWMAHVRADLRAVYAVRSKKLSSGKMVSIKMHRLITNAPKGYEVDHIDSDGLNNQKKNLRICTTAQNQHNSRLNRNNTSGYKGVHWIESRGVWRTCIRVNGKKKHVGEFKDIIDAAKAYDKIAIELRGEFARTNFDVD